LRIRDLPTGRALETENIGAKRSRPFYQSARTVALFEPRIELIRKQLLSLLAVVDLEKDGEVVAVDGFRLKNLHDWLAPSTGDPLEVYGYGGSRCDANCVFCYHKGNPSSIAFGNDYRTAAEAHHEMVTRLKYFSPRARSALFASLGNVHEILTNQHVIEILSVLREKTERPFRITTNGHQLTSALIEALAKLKPVYLHLSLHSASESRRRELVRSPSAPVAIKALPLLRAAEIPYAVVIVPWPSSSVEELIDDLDATVAYVDAFDPHLIEVHLPGYSQYFSPEKLFDREETWSALVGAVRGLRERTTTPIVIMPSMYEENLYEERKNLATVIGLVKNSPAARSGLAVGDLITAVNGIAISSRPQARDFLSLLARSGATLGKLTVRRSGRMLTVNVNLQDYAYPYEAETSSHLGVVMMGTGLRTSALERLKEIIDERKAGRVLFLTSTLMKPSLQQALRESPFFGAPNLLLDLAIPRNRFFGGNIIMGDLLVVQDFIDAVEEHLAAGNARPDLIVIPSTPFGLGRFKRDLTGRVFLDIERQVGIPVALLDCDTIYD